MSQEEETSRLMISGKRSVKQPGNNGTFDTLMTNISTHPGTTVFHEPPNTNNGGCDDDEQIYTLYGEFHTALSTLWQIKVLLVFVPLMFIAKWMDASDGPLFVFSFFALIPLAALLGDFTEDICKRSNEVVGALINVTFGNATELIISFMALRAGLFQLIKFALIGSILGNMLLVLGTGLLLGGLRRKVLRFSVEASNTYIPLLMLSVMSFLIPSGYGMTLPHRTAQQEAVSASAVLSVSRCIALITAFVYVCYLWFQLVTHKEMFDDSSDNTSNSEEGSNNETSLEASGEEENDERPDFTLRFAVVGLAVVSLLISYASDVLVDSVQGAALQYGIPSQFIGLILVPIVGNAAEHATAVIMAQKGRLDVAVGVALGSSIQIALFVMPVLVLGGWATHQPLDMNFHPFATAVLLVCTLVCSQIIADGKSNWLEGVMLVGAYIMVGVTVFHGDPMA
eukprot:CAMPEP_0176420958 /NCGR_PEP_ID=MMETSP0127-20121128/8900_1 /TAXON_ID=938130 /ORGANISM="Platyophrya macrostoma, Strain WH" /LENGTH=453 /DNA_ID=CAMNT_0017801621 /DNA_START=65 /DNA_END=1426 /DNA_ORIENTATION=-